MYKLYVRRHLMLSVGYCLLARDAAAAVISTDNMLVSPVPNYNHVLFLEMLVNSDVLRVTALSEKAVSAASYEEVVATSQCPLDFT